MVCLGVVIAQQKLARHYELARMTSVDRRREDRVFGFPKRSYRFFRMVRFFRKVY